MSTGSSLERILTYYDLMAIGVASIMGSGGFNLIGDAIRTGGQHFVVSLGIIAALFQGASYTYDKAFQEFKSNTSESDIIHEQFGPIASGAATISILLFNLVSVSVVLVICSKLLFPRASWSGQISFALTILAVMTAVVMRGMDLDKNIISIFSAAIVLLLTFVSFAGVIEATTDGIPNTFITPKKEDFVKSLMYFYFVLAGFDALMKFVEETREPEKDIPSSFYWSNILSAILTAGVCFAYVITSSHIPIHENDNIISKILGTVLGKGVESGVNILSILLMCITGFIAFLSSTRYLYSISPPNTVLKELNENKVPWATVIISFIVIFAGILNNHVYTLVMLCDIALTCTLLLVSAAATRLAITKGEAPVIEGATTLGFIGLLTISLLYK